MGALSAADPRRGPDARGPQRPRSDLQEETGGAADPEQQHRGLPFPLGVPSPLLPAVVVVSGRAAAQPAQQQRGRRVPAGDSHRQSTEGHQYRRPQ